MKQHHLILISFLIVLILVLGFVSAYVAEGSLLTYNGFSVDSNHRIYFGKENGELSVYKNGKCINKVSIPARGYSFTIQNGNELVFLNGEDLSYYSIHDSNNDLLSLVKRWM